MITYEEFREVHHSKNQFGVFTDKELSALAEKLPLDIVNFLKEEGRCSYSNQIIWTCHPNEFYEILSQWGLGKNCHAFIRTAFGGCIYYSRKNFYSFDSIKGTINNLNDEVYTLINVFLTFNFLLNHTWHLNILDSRKNLPLLKPDEIYALVPALPLGGSLENSQLEVVKMFEHLSFLAQLFDGKVRKL